jgi:hypothetical protein
VKFPTGGKPREPTIGMNWCNSSGDSKVWMKEVTNFFSMARVFSGFFYEGGLKNEKT